MTKQTNPSANYRRRNRALWPFVLVAAISATGLIWALAAKAEPAKGVNIPAGAVVDCLPFPSLETLKRQTVYENGKPAFGGVVTCVVIPGQLLPSQARFVGQLVSGPVPKSFTFNWEVLQLPDGVSIKWDSAGGELLSSIQINNDRLQLTFKRALNVPHMTD